MYNLAITTETSWNLILFCNQGLEISKQRQKIPICWSGRVALWLATYALKPKVSGLRLAATYAQR